jgi:hypothetical protein
MRDLQGVRVWLVAIVCASDIHTSLGSGQRPSFQKSRSPTDVIPMSFLCQSALNTRLRFCWWPLRRGGRAVALHYSSDYLRVGVASCTSGSCTWQAVDPVWSISLMVTPLTPGLERLLWSMQK